LSIQTDLRGLATMPPTGFMLETARDGATISRNRFFCIRLFPIGVKRFVKSCGFAWDRCRGRKRRSIGPRKNLPQCVCTTIGSSKCCTRKRRIFTIALRPIFRKPVAAKHGRKGPSVFFRIRRQPWMYFSMI